MYVENFKNKKEENFDNQEDYSDDDPQDQSAKNVLLHWQAPEYEIYEKSRKWYLYALLLLAVIVAFAVYTESPVMAITFILIGVVGYIFVNRTPRILDFLITHDGIIAGRDLYEFDNMIAFWIFYEPGQVKVISLHMKNKIMPFVHIPIHDEDPLEIRRILLEYVPEIKQEPSIVDTFERFLGI
ncbi:MAG: hypothetical protein WCX17_01735 [Parcubacteria group bacterium]|jgi:hypothetical protein